MDSARACHHHRNRDFKGSQLGMCDITVFDRDVRIEEETIKGAECGAALAFHTIECSAGVPEQQARAAAPS